MFYDEAFEDDEDFHEGTYVGIDDVYLDDQGYARWVEEAVFSWG